MIKATLFLSTLLLSIFIWLPLPAMELKTVAQDSTPKYYLDENGEIQGLLPDIIRALEKVDPELSFIGYNEVLPFKRMKIYLELGKIDLFFGMSRNPKREQSFIYPDKPLYQVKHVVAVRADDPVSVNNFNEIAAMGSKGVILTLYGTSTHRYIKKQAQKLMIDLQVDNGGRNVQALLLKLQGNRGRFAYYHSLGLIGTLKKMGLEEKIKILPATFRSYHHWVVFSKHCSKVKKDRVIAALDKLRTRGDLRKIAQKYLNH